MKLDNLQSLFMLTLQDLYDAEHQITQAIPQMLEFAQSKELKDALTAHLEETRGQIERLNLIAAEFDINLEDRNCVGMEGIIEEATELMQEATPSWTLDAGLIASAQKAEHYEIAGYGTAAAYAKQLGYKDALNSLLDTLEEEKNADHKLTSLAEGLINREAEKDISAPKAL